MNHITRLFALLCCCLGLSACASMTSGTQQTFTVQTHQGDVERTGIACDLQNDAGRWTLNSPASVTVHKSAEKLVVECKGAQVLGKVSVESTANAAYASNFLFLFGIGYWFDKLTGAGFDYPDKVIVRLNPGT
ncbi:MAG: hypothetical protein ABII81_06600 [Pseudomonadota bacterium]